MRLEPLALPDARHAVGRDADLPSQRAGAPALPAWWRLAGLLDHPPDRGQRNRRLRPRNGSPGFFFSDRCALLGPPPVAPHLPTTTRGVNNAHVVNHRLVLVLCLVTEVAIAPQETTYRAPVMVRQVVKTVEVVSPVPASAPPAPEFATGPFPFRLDCAVGLRQNMLVEQRKQPPRATPRRTICAEAPSTPPGCRPATSG